MPCLFPEHHSSGHQIPVKAAAIVLALAAAGGVARAVHPHVPWKLLAFAATLAGCGLLALGGLLFARWEERRQEPEPLRYRSGERIREPRR